MKPVTAREIPEGYQLDWNDQIWNVGYAFRWSEVYGCYLDEGRMSVRPGDSLPEAFERAFDMPYTSEYEIFFLKEMP